jgi:hypothetical protein
VNEDMKRVLDELEHDLLDDDLLEDIPQNLNKKSEDDVLDEILARILAESDDFVGDNGEIAPAFEDPDKLNIAQEPEVYCNYSNDYGNERRKRARTADQEAEMAKKRSKKDDKWLIALMGVASGLCLGIIAVLIYWLEAFLK